LVGMTLRPFFLFARPRFRHRRILYCASRNAPKEKKEKGFGFVPPCRAHTTKFLLPLLFTILDFWCSIAVEEKKYHRYFNSTTTISDMSNINKNLRKLRETKGLSQEKLARLADVANNTIIKIEAGKNKNPTLETLRKKLQGVRCFC